MDIGISKPMATLAPAPAVSDSTTTPPSSQPVVMPFNCQPCVVRKVKCDRLRSACSSCTRRKISCHYQAPAPPRKRKYRQAPVDDIHQRLARYERILSEHGLLSSISELGSGPGVASPSTSLRNESTLGSSTGVAETESRRLGEGCDGVDDSNDHGAPGEAKQGKLLSRDGRVRYIDSNVWINAADEEMQAIMDEDESDPRQRHDGIASLGKPADPLSQALLGLTHSLTAYHPPHETAMKLWRAYTENVEPLCRILHTPTTAQMVEAVSKHPKHATQAQECLLFAIYYFAVHSMPLETLCDGEQPSVLLARYQAALQQALVNASWLRTTEFPVIQAYVLYLIASRATMDPHTYWVLIGVAIRLAQRIGLHRDGENLGLPPFEVQMRRRLFWQLLPLDGYAGQMSGTGVFLSPDSWDTKMPLNVNDADIWPGMTSAPTGIRGATDMIFGLCKIELSNFYIRTSLRSSASSSETTPKSASSPQPKSGPDLEATINDVEAIIEAQYLRYCDVVQPLHFLTLAITRSAVNMVRLRSRLPGILDGSISPGDRRSAVDIALRVLDTDRALYANPDLVRFRWHTQNFFLKDAMIVVLASLGQPGFFAEPEERDGVWEKVASVYANHAEPYQRKRALYILVARVTMQAWRVNPPTVQTPEPFFIAHLRALQKKSQHGQHREVESSEQRNRSESDSSADKDGGTSQAPAVAETAFPGDAFDNVVGFPSGSIDDMLASFSGEAFTTDMGLDSMTMDWTLWDDSAYGLNQ